MDEQNQNDQSEFSSHRFEYKKSNANGIIGILFVIILGLMLFCGWTIYKYAQDDTSETDELNVGVVTEQDAANVADSVIDSCVFVSFKTSTNTKLLSGSGVCVKEGGYIVTNYHVISSYLTESKYTGLVITDNYDVSYDATLLWYNQDLDVAIIKTNSTANLQVATMKDRWISCKTSDKLTLYENVIAIGTPIKVENKNTCTWGKISSSEYRTGLSDTRVYENLIQHSATLSNGNSGGGLFDMQGNLIGLNTLGTSDATSVFYSVPIYPVMVILDKVVACYQSSSTYKIPSLGVTYFDSVMYGYGVEKTSIAFTSTGVKVKSGSSNLLAGSIIAKIVCNNVTYTITDRNSVLYFLLNSTKGDKAVVYYTLGSINTSVEITLGE